VTNYNKDKYIDYIRWASVFITFLFFIQILQAQKGDTYLFSVGSKTVTMSGNGEALSTSDNKNSAATNNKTIKSLRVAGYSNDIFIGDNSDISIWKENKYSAVFYFPIDRHILLRDYSSNRASLAALDMLINNIEKTGMPDTVEIVGACSPVGNEDYNLILALSRCMAMRSYLRWKHRDFAERFPIKFEIVGVDKRGYNILKKEKPSLGEKQIWDLLQYTAICIKMKDGSRIIPCLEKQDITEENKPEKQIEVPATVLPLAVHDTVFLKSDTMYIYYNDEIVKTSPAWYGALKTNLLYDAVLLPNLTAELYIGRKWSLAVEGNWSWWTFDRPVQNQWHHRIQVAGVELRKWIKSPYPLQGHAIGIYSMTGNYDVRLFTKDEYSKGWLSYQSWSAGLSYSYSMPIARRLNLEFGMAFGYVGGRYYQYDYCMTHKHFPPRAVFNRNYIGPTRIGVSLVLRLGAGNDDESKNNFYARERQKHQQLYGLNNK
jgi:hypothetical protein